VFKVYNVQTTNVKLPVYSLLRITSTPKAGGSFTWLGRFTPTSRYAEAWPFYCQTLHVTGCARSTFHVKS